VSAVGSRASSLFTTISRFPTCAVTTFAMGHVDRHDQHDQHCDTKVDPENETSI
jgi:hypothetical protein